MLWRLSLVVLALLSGCTAARETAAPSLVGTWAYTMNNPTHGTLTGTMVIEATAEGGFTGRLRIVEVGLDEEMRIDALRVEDGRFLVAGSVVYGAPLDFTLSGTIDGGVLTGHNDVPEAGLFTFRATRAAD